MHIVATSFSPFSAFSDPREGGGREWFREEKGLSKLLRFRRLARFYYRHTPYGGHAQPHTWGRWVGRRRRQDGCFHYHHHHHHHYFDFILHLLLFYNIIIVELHLLLHSYCFLLPSTLSLTFQSPTAAILGSRLPFSVYIHSSSHAQPSLGVHRIRYFLALSSTLSASRYHSACTKVQPRTGTHTTEQDSTRSSTYSTEP